MDSKRYSKLFKYQNAITKFMKGDNVINKLSDKTKNIFIKEIDNSKHISAILCLTIMNSQIKNNNFKYLHGYYLASAISFIDIISNININKTYYEKLYGKSNLNNSISEIITFLHILILENIETLKSNICKVDNMKTDKTIRKITLKCNEYYMKYINIIMNNFDVSSNEKMIKTDVLSLNFSKEQYINYKKKNRVDKNSIDNIILDKKGSVYILSVCLGWLIGCGNDDKLVELEELGKDISILMKIFDDFNNIDRDLIVDNNITLNYVLNHGAKETFINFIDLKTNYIEKAMKLNVDTKTTNEIISLVESQILDCVKDISIDLNSKYDDVSSLSLNK